ncbi:hypothetical protein E4P42_22525 [Mycobacterium sp. PS03-16]|uniref:hypothetical protein n=1 Tax=Mycobacterium sp. PS03-16 TaxID=2559611 RepID=UPI00107453B3|nr:hypothetical protein [Mycobacterium sp. PS03-16]TFV55505.1 hypothetical protein E4P42_22525 [Mycobacterium sp. PS03-16]
MPAAARSLLAAGVAAVGAAAIVAAPAVTPLPEPSLTSEIRMTAAHTITPAFRDIVAEVALRALPAPPSPPPASGPSTQNALSNAIIQAWDFAVPWIDYGVELADYVLGFIPFGYAISDQITIFYDSLFPIADTFVRDLVAPVVDQPLNLAVWVEGISDLVVTTVESVINLGINEFNYFFGWLIPPLPPIGLQTAALVSEDPVEEVDEVSAPLMIEGDAAISVETVADEEFQVAQDATLETGEGEIPVVVEAADDDTVVTEPGDEPLTEEPENAPVVDEEPLTDEEPPVDDQPVTTGGDEPSDGAQENAESEAAPADGSDNAVEGGAEPGTE